MDRAQPVALTQDDASQWTPIVSNQRVVFIDAGARKPPMIAAMRLDGGDRHLLQSHLLPADFPAAQLVTPKAASFTAADGTLAHGQLFRRDDAGANQPGVIFVHADRRGRCCSAGTTWITTATVTR